jgi:hypothetical protein
MLLALLLLHSMPRERLRSIARESILQGPGISRTLEAAGVEFIDENGGGPGVRLKKRTRTKSTR